MKNFYFCAFVAALISGYVLAANAATKPEIYALSPGDAETCSRHDSKCTLVTKAVLDGMRKRVREAEEALEAERNKPPVERFCT